MIRNFLFIISLIILACSEPESASTETAQESIPIALGYNLRVLEHGGLLRQYIVHVPASYTSGVQMPVVLNFHGYGGTATFQYNRSGLIEVAEREGFILVTPQGSVYRGATHWSVGGTTFGSSVDDVDFIYKLIDALDSNFSINTSRIYSTGMSNGGYMSFLLACELSDKIAAIASVTGSMTPQTYTACNPTRAVPVLQIHGSRDSVVPYAGAVWTLSIPSVLDFWISINDCYSEAIITEIQDIVPDDESTVTHLLYEGASADVSHFKINGGNHQWPGQSGNFDISAAEEIWKFFSQYDINGKLD